MKQNKLMTAMAKSPRRNVWVDRTSSRPGGPPPRRRTGLRLLMLLALLAAALAVWSGLDSDAPGRLVSRFWQSEPKVRSLTLEVAGRQRILQPYQFLQIHPRDPIRVVEFDSNRWKNHGLKLSSPDLDLSRLTEPRSLLELMGEATFYEPHQFVVQVVDDERAVADFYLLVSMSALDWAAMSEQADNTADKIRYMRLAARFEPRNLTVRDRLASLLEQDGQFGPAAILHERTYSETSDPAALIRLLTVYRAAGDETHVIDTYTRLIDTAEGERSREYQREFGAYLENRGKIAAAVQVYHELAEHLDPPESLVVLERVAALHRSAGQNEKYEETLAKLASLAGGEAQDRYLWELAAHFESEGRPQKAIEVFETILGHSSGPQKLQILERIARLSRTAGLEEKYVAALLEIIETAPDERSEVYLSELAAYYEKNGRVDEAVKTYETLLSRLPEEKRGPILSRIVQMHRESGDAAGFVAVLNRLIEAGSSDQVPVHLKELAEFHEARESSPRRPRLTIVCAKGCPRTVRPGCIKKSVSCTRPSRTTKRPLKTTRPPPGSTPPTPMFFTTWPASTGRGATGTGTPITWPKPWSLSRL